MKNLIQNKDIDNLDNITHYQLKTLQQNYKDLLSMVYYDYEEDMIETHAGDEARTFHIMNRSKPLLSPSRITKIFTEHRYWVIGNAKMLRPRLLGQIIHTNIEKHYKLDTPLNELMIDWSWIENNVSSNELEIINKNWNKEAKDRFIKEINDATQNIIKYLKQKKIEVLACEKHICDNEYHGFVDLIAQQQYTSDKSKTNQPKKIFLIDLKISKEKKIKPEWVLQLAIYRRIFKSLPSCYILWYNTEKEEARLEKISLKEMNNILKLVDKLNDIIRNNASLFDFQINIKNNLKNQGEEN